MVGVRSNSWQVRGCVLGLKCCFQGFFGNSQGICGNFQGFNVILPAYFRGEPVISVSLVFNIEGLNFFKGAGLRIKTSRKAGP